MPKNKNYVIKVYAISPMNTQGISTNGKFSVDIKFMPNGFDDLKYFLVATCKITNFVLSIPINSRSASYSCNKYNDVFAPGILGSQPDTYLVPVNCMLGLGVWHIDAR